jgi:hypothetical protein
MEAVHFFKFRASLPVDPLDMTAAPHPGFLVQGHILSTGGDALRHPPCSRSFLPEFSHVFFFMSV